MDANKMAEIVYKKESYAIIGARFEVVSGRAPRAVTELSPRDRL